MSGGHSGRKYRFLRQISEAGSRLQKSLARIEVDRSRQGAKQRRLAAAIAPDQAGALAAAQRGRNKAERRLATERDGRVAQGEDGGGAMVGTGRIRVDR